MAVSATSAAGPVGRHAPANSELACAVRNLSLETAGRIRIDRLFLTFTIIDGVDGNRRVGVACSVGQKRTLVTSRRKGAARRMQFAFPRLQRGGTRNPSHMEI